MDDINFINAAQYSALSKAMDQELARAKIKKAQQEAVAKQLTNDGVFSTPPPPS